MILELTREERDALAEILQIELSDLGPEIRRTDSTEYRNELKAERETLRGVLDRLLADQPR